MEAVWIGLTTFENRESASVFVRGVVGSKLGACAQVEGPVVSVYSWEGAVCESSEYRVWVKFLAEKAEALKTYVEREHPYGVPQWVAWPVGSVSEPYRAWMVSVTS